MKNQTVLLLVFLSLSLNARLLNISIEQRAYEAIKKYSSFNLILGEEYYTKLPINEIENNIYELTKNFVKSILKDKIDYKLIISDYREAIKHLIKSEIIDKKFFKYKIFKVKNINNLNKIFKSSTLIYTKTGFYKVELYTENKNKKNLRIFNLNVVYFLKDLDEINNEMIFLNKN